MQKFNEAILACSSEQEISEFCQMITTISSKTIHGIEGRKFKKDFLRAAINDDEKIMPQKVTAH